MITADSIRRLKRVRRVAVLSAVALSLALLSGLLGGGGAAQAQGLGTAYDLPPRNCVPQEVMRLGTEQQFLWGSGCDSQFFAATDSAYIRFTVNTSGDYTITAEAPDDFSFIALFNSNGRNLANSTQEDENGLFNFLQISSVSAELRPGEYWLEVSAHATPPNSGIFTLSVFESGTQFSASSLEGIFRPLVGGIRISGGVSDCTLGFTVVVSTPMESFNGIVTNSHCTESEDRLDATRFQQGGLDGTVAGGERAESVRLSDSSRLTAFREARDRRDCGLRCGYSDASLFELNDGTGIDVNSIARPREINILSPAQVADRHDGTRFWLDVDRAAPHFRVTGIGSARRGDTVHKVGATTGWTSGRVTDECIDIEQGGTTNLLCQAEVVSEHVFQGNGDSGSPVFVCVDGNECGRSNEVILVGLMHSGNDVACAASEPDVCYGSEGFFTPIESVLQDLRDDLLTQVQGPVCWRIGGQTVGNEFACAPALNPGGSSGGADPNGTTVFPPSGPTPDAGCRVHRLNLNTSVAGSWSNSCQGIELDPPIVPRESCYSNIQTYRFSRYYQFEISNEAALQITYEGADCIRILSRQEFSAGRALGIGAGEGFISFFFIENNSFVEVPIEAFPEGSYFIELAAINPGDFALMVCQAGQACAIEAEASPPPPPPPPPAPPPATPVEDSATGPSNTLVWISLGIAALCAVLLIILAIFLIRWMLRYLFGGHRRSSDETQMHGAAGTGDSRLRVFTSDDASISTDPLQSEAKASRIGALDDPVYGEQRRALCRKLLTIRTLLDGTSTADVALCQYGTAGAKDIYTSKDPDEQHRWLLHMRHATTPFSRHQTWILLAPSDGNKAQIKFTDKYFDRLAVLVLESKDVADLKCDEADWEAAGASGR